MSYKPDGYTDLAAYLLVPDPEAVLRFCETVFDGARLRVMQDGARIMHAEIRIGDTVLMIGGMEGAPPTMLHLYISDPDAAFARALEAGAEEIQPMREEGDGDRRGGFRSPCGTQWYVARQVQSAA
ncbi:bleomycin resistance protein [Salipiger bermudensis]|uniref:VOC family protein n=1 Tax=Salipiger bermudensis TaxID=344736 RepID=UPI001C99B818|nr:VOC family protein [Salipiger bermudensis]MBY6005959.1 bleomycin resistance protein [Salipiger bermudensis]